MAKRKGAIKQKYIYHILYLFAFSVVVCIFIETNRSQSRTYCFDSDSRDLRGVSTVEFVYFVIV